MNKIENSPKHNNPFKVLTVNNFGSSNMEPWCRLDIFEVKSRIASVFVSYNEFIIDGTTTNQVEAPPKVGFNSIPSKDENPRVSRVRKCVGKGIQIHTDDDKNVWCTRKGKNGCFVQGKFVSDDVKSVNNELTQGVPFKILDHVKLNEYLSSIKSSDELNSTHVDSCKVVISFIKDPAKDNELPLWIELWILNCVKYLENLMETSTAKVEKEEKNSRRKSEMILNYNHINDLDEINIKLENQSLNKRSTNSFSQQEYLIQELTNKNASNNKNVSKTPIANIKSNQQNQQQPITPSLVTGTPLRNPKEDKNKSKIVTTTLKPSSIISSISNAFFRSKTQDEMNIKKKNASTYGKNQKVNPTTADIISGKLLSKTDRLSDQTKYTGMSYTQMIKETNRQ